MERLVLNDLVALRIGRCRVRVGVTAVISPAIGSQVGVIGRGDDRDGACAALIRIAQIVCHLLDFIGFEVVVVEQNKVMRWSRCSFETSMTQKEEVVLSRMADGRVNHSACRDVASLVTISLLDREEPRVVALLHDDERDPGRIVLVEFTTATSNRIDFHSKHSLKLTLSNTIAIEDDRLRLDFVVELIELDQQLFEDLVQINDDLRAVLLRPHHRGVARRETIETANHCSDRWTTMIGWGRMMHVGTQDDCWSLNERESA